jgi:hypothetical protein
MRIGAGRVISIGRRVTHCGLLSSDRFEVGKNETFTTLVNFVDKRNRSLPSASPGQGPEYAEGYIQQVFLRSQVSQGSKFFQFLHLFFIEFDLKAIVVHGWSRTVSRLAGFSSSTRMLSNNRGAVNDLQHVGYRFDMNRPDLSKSETDRSESFLFDYRGIWFVRLYWY